MAIKFKILFCKEYLREGLPNVADTTKALLAFTDPPNKFPSSKAAALATDNTNKDKIPVPTLLRVAVVPFG